MDTQLVFVESCEGRGRQAYESCRQLGVKEIAGYGSAGTVEDLEILSGGMHHNQDI
tara:strand:+ start:341 stop:508 length:168 start_codon:yes stop_codon:yes gene_type:complete